MAKDPRYSIGRSDCKPMILPVMIPPLAVDSIRFPTLEDAQRFQDYLKITDPRGLARGDYFLDPMESEDEIDWDYEPEGPEIPA